MPFPARGNTWSLCTQAQQWNNHKPFNFLPYLYLPHKLSLTSICSLLIYLQLLTYVVTMFKTWVMTEMMPLQKKICTLCCLYTWYRQQKLYIAQFACKLMNEIHWPTHSLWSSSAHIRNSISAYTENFKIILTCQMSKKVCKRVQSAKIQI